METLTFEQLPSAVARILEKITGIEEKISAASGPGQESSLDRMLTIKETAEFLDLAVPTIYSLISRGQIPFLKRSKRVYFLYDDLVSYLKAGRHKSKDELYEDAADKLIITKHRRRSR